MIDLFQMFIYKLKWKIRRLFLILKTKKCEASGCKRRIERKYCWCSLECGAYCGLNLKTGKVEDV